MVSSVRNQERRTKNQEPRTQTGFTLTELLVVITIIAILLGLLYGAIRTVARYSRETITRGELANIEAAWKQYHAYYHTWPSNAVETGTGNYTCDRAPDGSDITFEIGPRIASLLAGSNVTDTSGKQLNVDSIPFLELTRFEQGTAAPINAWGDLRGKHYFVKLDLGGRNTLTVPTDMSGIPTNVLRGVAAWTEHPDKPGVVIGSWMQ